MGNGEWGIGEVIGDWGIGEVIGDWGRFFLPSSFFLLPSSFFLLPSSFVSNFRVCLNKPQ
jgi:hypothetical protein